MLKRVLIVPIRFYQRFLSPLKRTPSCRYLPTCSSYAIEAIERRGVIVGSLKALWRILRCNPLFRGGYDPVDPPHTCGRDAVEDGLDSSQVSAEIPSQESAHDTPTTVRV